MHSPLATPAVPPPLPVVTATPNPPGPGATPNTDATVESHAKCVVCGHPAAPTERHCFECLGALAEDARERERESRWDHERDDRADARIDAAIDEMKGK